MKTIQDIKNELPDVPVKRPDGSVVTCRVRGSSLPFPQIHTPNGGVFQCTWDLVWRVVTGQVQYLTVGGDEEDYQREMEYAAINEQIKEYENIIFHQGVELGRARSGVEVLTESLRMVNGELEKVKEDVIHWRGARQSAIEGGDMLKVELDQFRKLCETLTDEISETRKQRDAAQGERYMVEQQVQELRDQIKRMTEDLNEERAMVHEDGFKQGWKTAMDRLPELEITGPEQGETIKGRITYCFDEGDHSVGIPSSDWIELDQEV